MKHEFLLAPNQRADEPATGRYVGYVSGPGEIEITINGQVHHLDVREAVRADMDFQQFSVRNVSGQSGTVLLKTGAGSLYMAGDGQLTEVTRIAETVAVSVADTLKTEITNQVTAQIAGTVAVSVADTLKTEITNQVTAQIAGSVNIRPITETLNSQVTGVVSVGGTVAVSPETNGNYLSSPPILFDSNQSQSVSADVGRVALILKAAPANVGEIWVGGESLGIPLGAGEKIEINTAGGVDLYATNAADTLYISEIIK